MKKLTMGLFAAAAMLIAVPEAMAGHHGKCNDGLRLAAGIVNLAKEIAEPAMQVVYAPPPVVVAPPPPVVVAPPPPVVYHKPEPPKVYRPQHRPAKPHKPQPPRGGRRR